MEEPVKEKNNWEEYLEDFRKTCEKVGEMVLDLYNGNEKILEDMERSPKTEFFVAFVYPSLKESGKLNDEISEKVEAILRKKGWIDEEGKFPEWIEGTPEKDGEDHLTEYGPLPTPYIKQSFLTLMTSKITNSIFIGDFNEFKDGGYIKDISTDWKRGNYKKPNVKTSLLLIPPEEIRGVSIEKPLTPFDRAVLNAIHTIWESGARRFTPQNVYETMTGEKTRNQTMLLDIVKSINKLDNTKVILNLEELAFHYNNSKYLPDVSKKFKGRLLNVDNYSWTDEFNKNTVQEGYVFLREPVLYQVCKDFNNQLTAVPKNWLSPPKKTISNNAVSITIRQYLLLRIQKEKNLDKKIITVLYETLLQETMMNGENKIQLSRDREKIKSILDEWKGMENGPISDYKIHYKGQSPYSIEITL